MFKSKGKKHEIIQLQSTFKKTLLLMSVACASFGTEHSLEFHIQDGTRSMRPATFESSSQLQKEPKLSELSEMNAPLAFLEDLTKMLQDMSQLEQTVESLLPQHPHNPTNVRYDPLFKTTDWRILKFFLTEPFSLKTATKEEKGKAIEEAMKYSDNAKKKREEKYNPAKVLAREPHKSTTQEHSQQKLSEELGVWFTEACNVPYHRASTLKERIRAFSQWLNTLPFLGDEPWTVNYLNRLLEKDRQSPQILNTLKGWMFEDIRVRAQTLYEQLWPLYLESKISLNSLKNAKLEIEREESALNALMQNWSLFGSLHIDMAEAITGTIEVWLEQNLKKVKATEFNNKITDSIRQAICEVKGLSIFPLGKSDPNMVATFREVIERVLEEALFTAFQQAIGQQSTKLKFNPTKKVWTVKVGEDTSVYSAPTYELEKGRIAINVAPILQTLYQSISSHLGFWDKKSPGPIKVVQLPIREEVQNQWKISRYQTKPSIDTTKTFRGVKILEIINSKRKNEHPEVNPKPAPMGGDPMIWKDYLEASGFSQIESGLPIDQRDFQKIKERQALLNQIRQSRAQDNWDDAREFSQLSLTTNTILEKVMRFFQQCMLEISSIQKTLEIGPDRMFYLNTARTDIDFLKNPERKYQRIQSLFRQGLHAKDWKQISALMTNPPIFPRFDNETAESILLKQLAFAKDVKELVMMSLILDNLYEKAKNNETLVKSCIDYNDNYIYDTENISMFTDFANRLCKLFDYYGLTISHQDDSFILLANMSRIPSDFKIQELLTRVKSGKSDLDFESKYETTWHDIMKFFSCLFTDHLGRFFHLIDENMFERLKKLYLPTLREFEKTKDFNIVTFEESAPTVQDHQILPLFGMNLPEELGAIKTPDNSISLETNLVSPAQDATKDATSPSSPKQVVTQQHSEQPSVGADEVLVSADDAQSTPLLSSAELKINTDEGETDKNNAGPFPTEQEQSTLGDDNTSRPPHTSNNAQPSSPINQSAEVNAEGENGGDSNNGEISIIPEKNENTTVAAEKLSRSNSNSTSRSFLKKSKDEIGKRRSQ